MARHVAKLPLRLTTDPHALTPLPTQARWLDATPVIGCLKRFVTVPAITPMMFTRMRLAQFFTSPVEKRTHAVGRAARSKQRFRGKRLLTPATCLSIPVNVSG